MFLFLTTVYCKLNREQFAQIPTKFLVHWLEHITFMSRGQDEILFIR